MLKKSEKYILCVSFNAEQHLTGAEALCLNDKLKLKFNVKPIYNWYGATASKIHKSVYHNFLTSGDFSPLRISRTVYYIAKSLKDCSLVHICVLFIVKKYTRV